MGAGLLKERTSWPWQDSRGACRGRAVLPTAQVWASVFQLQVPRLELAIWSPEVTSAHRPTVQASLVVSSEGTHCQGGLDKSSS